MTITAATHDDRLPAQGGDRRVADRVAERLRAMITSGAVAPGERLPGERQLAESMGVSRVSVRAALQCLKAQGFLEAVQGGGTRVISSATCMDPPLALMARLNLDNLRDLAEIRVILEVWAARRAAESATPEALAELAETVETMEASRLRGCVTTSHDMRFHFAVAKASGSAVYTHIMRVIRDILIQMMEHNRKTRYTPEDDRDIVVQHRAIMESIREKDGDAAAAAMERHLRWVIAHHDAEIRATSGR
ncbi:MAG: FadR family transcriptional regulator [Alphaproteobacteria bacterium]|nr:FadR family transcriptional regulator [Alphaproteobacteria bacterium]